MSNSYKVGCYTFGSTKPGYNGLRFATAEEARLYASDLFSRWMALREYSIDESDDEPNWAVVEGKLVSLSTGRVKTAIGPEDTVARR